jgi:hypothetical protein
VLRGTLLVSLITIFIYMIFRHFEFFDLNQVNNGTILLYIVFAICSVYIFDKLNLLVQFIINKFDKDYSKVKV